MLQACGSGRSFCRDVEPNRQPSSELWRYEIDLRMGRVAAVRRLCDHVLEFPAVNPRHQGARCRSLLLHILGSGLGCIQA